jgi:hypothetical protein
VKMDYLLSCLGIQTAYLGHKHYRPGWINVECPWCSGNPGFHLGWNLEDEYFYCWRCGWKPLLPTIRKLAENRSWKEIRALIEEAEGFSILKKTPPTDPIPKKSSLKLPSGAGPLNPAHRDYLSRRGLDSDEIEKEWKVMGTGPVSFLEGVDYKHRILAPVFWENQMVSFQARDITNQSPTKYKACPKHLEILHHKNIFYLHPDALTYRSVIVVEGIFDSWKMGKRSIALFGISYKLSQVKWLTKLFDQMIVIFDQDTEAQAQAHRLVSEIRMTGKKAHAITLPPGTKDPGSLPLDEARKWAKELLSPKIYFFCKEGTQ